MPSIMSLPAYIVIIVEIYSFLTESRKSGGWGVNERPEMAASISRVQIHARSKDLVI